MQIIYIKIKNNRIFIYLLKNDKLILSFKSNFEVNKNDIINDSIIFHNELEHVLKNFKNIFTPPTIVNLVDINENDKTIKKYIIEILISIKKFLNITAIIKFNDNHNEDLIKNVLNEIVNNKKSKNYEYKILNNFTEFTSTKFNIIDFVPLYLKSIIIVLSILITIVVIRKNIYISNLDLKSRNKEKIENKLEIISSKMISLKKKSQQINFELSILEPFINNANIINLIYFISQKIPDDCRINKMEINKKTDKSYKIINVTGNTKRLNSLKNFVSRLERNKNISSLKIETITHKNNNKSKEYDFTIVFHYVN